VAVTVVLAAKPVPLIESEVPAPPLLGESEIAGDTPKLALPV
jgi:hypothetical protein